MHKLTFTSPDFSIRLHLEQKSYSWTGGNSESGDRNCTKNWWEGQGEIITNPNNPSLKNKEVFTISTRGFEKKLQEPLYELTNLTEELQIKNKPVFANFLGEKIHTKLLEAKTSNPDGIILHIKDVYITLDIDYLLNTGVLHKEGHQVALPLK